MKKFKLLFLVATIIFAVFYSCSDSNSIKDNQDAKKSIGLRTILNEFKKVNNISGRDAQTGDFCFDFVYPLTLSYNNGTTITVASFDGIIDVLTNENENLYIDGIVFPFQVVLSSDGSTVTINTEDDLWVVIDNCNFETYDDYTFNSLCYDFVYPFSLITQDNQTIVISSEADLNNLFTDPNANSVILDFVYPFSVIYNNETVVINNEYEFFEMNNNCDQSGCICPTVYAPVCVNTPNGTIQFNNDCEAECAGFTSADFVNCGIAPNTFNTQLGSCFTIQYPVQVQWAGQVVTITSDNDLVQYSSPATGNMPIFNYPIVVTFLNPTETFTFANQSSFVDQMNLHCN
jgi:hypothetical protein